VLACSTYRAATLTRSARFDLLASEINSEVAFVLPVVGAPKATQISRALSEAAIAKTLVRLGFCLDRVVQSLCRRAANDEGGMCVFGLLGWRIDDRGTANLKAALKHVVL
jgi:hypothetical protein